MARCWRYDDRAMAKRRRYLLAPAGYAVYRYLAAAGFPALAHPDGQPPRHRLQPSVVRRVSRTSSSVRVWKAYAEGT